MVLKYFQKILPVIVFLLFCVVPVGSQAQAEYPANIVVPVKSLDELSDTTAKTIAVPSGQAKNQTRDPSPSQNLSDSVVTQQELDSLAIQKKDSSVQVKAIASHGLGLASEKGLVLSAETGKPIANALVLLQAEGKRFSTVSNDDGLYALKEVEPGQYQMRVSKKGYSPFDGPDVTFLGGENPIREIKLERSVLKGQLIQAKGGYNAGGTAAILAARKSSGGVMEGVGAEQIAKSTDADAGAVAKRVTGASVIGGKFVYVRGLGERYTNMTLNGLPVPSPEKDKRVVPQDLFPASIIESFSIYKTLNADLPPDFAGGHIALVTKGVPEKNALKIDIGASATDFSGDGHILDLHERRLTYDGGGGWQSVLGFDDGTRSIPKGVPDNINQVDFGDTARAEFARKFNNKLAIDTTSMYASPSMSVSLSRVYPLSDDRKTGFNLYASVKHKFDESQVHKVKVSSELLKVPFERTINGVTFKSFKSVWDTVDGVPVPLLRVTPGLNYDITEGKHSVALTGLGNWGYQDPDNTLWAKSFFVNLAKDKTYHNVVTKIPGGSIALNGRDLEEHNTLDYERRHLLVSQIGGGHYLGASVFDSLSWVAGAAWTATDIPDSKKYYYLRDVVHLDIQNDTVINGRAYAAGTSVDLPGEAVYYEVRAPWGTRSWETLGEKGVSGRVDCKLIIPPEISSRSEFLKEGGFLSHVLLPQGKTGLYAAYRNREYDRITYDWSGIASVSDSTGDESLVERAHDPDVVYQRVIDKGQGFATSTKNYETYNAGEGQVSGYLGLSQNFKLLHIPTEITAGMRLEWYHLNFIAPYTGPEVIQNPKLREERQITINRDEFLWYPSAGIDFEFLPNTKTRFLYSSTLVRPEMRERAPIFFYDTEEEIEVIGNENLKDTRIQNFDFRFDYFLPYNQVLSLSAFYKDFKNPIEYYIDAVQVPNRRQYQNAKSAYVRGIEVEANAWLGPIFRPLPGPRLFWDGFHLEGNAAWMQSEVRLNRDAKGVVLVTSFKRPLLGQSPYLYNVKLSNEVESGKKSLLNAIIFNVFGPRIQDLGADGIPDKYERPFPSLDYLAKLKWGRHTFTFKTNNLLDQKIRSTIREFNQDKQYETISNTVRDSLYADVPNSYTVDEKTPGRGFSVNYSLDL